MIHVGANTGQERELYDNLNLRVLWIKPIPEIFETLKAKLKDFPGQRAIQYLVTDCDSKEYRLHVANNNGESSSIFELKYHKDIWPDVKYTNAILLKSITLTSLFEKENIDPFDYQSLIIDTQGSELLVLKGSAFLLSNFRYAKTEVADFESYEGCCQLADINSFMKQHGYTEFSRHTIAKRPQGGNYFAVVYKKRAAS
ncbi:MAG: FkbM family methyltransferase [Candidatus Omnitrophota bacterium]